METFSKQSTTAIKGDDNVITKTTTTKTKTLSNVFDQHKIKSKSRDTIVSNKKAIKKSPLSNMKTESFHFTPSQLRRLGRGRLLSEIEENESINDASEEFPKLESFLQSVWSGQRLGLLGIAKIASQILEKATLMRKELLQENNFLENENIDSKPSQIPSLYAFLSESTDPSSTSSHVSSEISNDSIRTSILSALISATEKRIAYLESAPSSATGSVIVGGLEQYAIQTFGLWSVDAVRPTICFISRRNKRFILNERELISSTMSWGMKMFIESGGIDFLIAPLEDMPLYEQLQLLRRTTILTGMHGSGLINSVFMHPGTNLLQLLPPKLKDGDRFFSGPASSAKVSYSEIEGEERNSRRHCMYLPILLLL